MSTGGYRSEPTWLDTRRPDWGRVAILPWDSDDFGFAVGTYELGDGTVMARDRRAWSEAFDGWAAEHGVELVSASTRGENLAEQALLTGLGFCAVDYALQVTLRRLQKVDLSQARMEVRLAEAQDQATVLEIAATAFSFGRYHLDPRFPRSLADKRYGRWVERALASASDTNQVWVIGEVGQPRGFMHVARDGAKATFLLGGIERTMQAGLLGHQLFAGILRELKACGTRTVTAKISAGNTAVLNLYTGLGFACGAPDPTYHWHWAGAQHLVPIEELSYAKRA